MAVPRKHRETAERYIKEKNIKIGVGIITVSTSRYGRYMESGVIDDPSGDLAARLIGEGGLDVLLRDLIPDDKEEILKSLQRALDAGCRVIIFIGGTGISKTDVTPDVLEGILQRKIDGFGEIFRYLSYMQIGSSAFLSRAIAGIIKDSIVFAIPGSPSAVQLALEKLILPEIHHILYLMDK